MKNTFLKAGFLTVALMFSACSSYYNDEIIPPTEQELEDAKVMRPSGAMRQGVFHMQRVYEGSAVRVEESIQLKRPDLPPFDVAYINRDLESVVLELSNAAGESVVIPEGLRGRRITLVHSGANFEEMMDIVLGKAGYHYNYVDGVWYITRYPIRNYVLELSQSDRTGSLIASTELQAEADDGGGTASATSELDTQYRDEVWKQVQDTLNELVKVGASELRAARGQVGETSVGGTLEPTGVNSGDGLDSLPPVDVDSAETTRQLFGTVTEGGGLRPTELDSPEGTSHLVPEEEAEPWYRVTKSAGLITVRAAPEAHRLIEEYLEQVQQSAHRQIVIEIRIVSVIKDRTTDYGTDFGKNFQFSDSALANLGFEASTPVTAAEAKGGIFSIGSITGSSIDFIVQALNTIGDVYTISSPKLIARNNQLSRVSITRQLGYAETEVEQNTTSSGLVQIGSRTDTARFKNAGTVFSAFPFIGKSKVQLRLRLSVASKIGDTTVATSVGSSDPITNDVPNLANNVIDQDMVLEFGRVYAIGGLIETSTDAGSSYIPGLADVPGMREVFQRATNRKQDTEFIVFLKVSRA